MAKIITKNGKKYNSVTGKEITPKFAKGGIVTDAAGNQRMTTEQDLKNQEFLGASQGKSAGVQLTGNVNPSVQDIQAALSKRKANVEQAKNLQQPTTTNLIPEDLPLQKAFEQNVPVLGPIAASLGTTISGENKAQTGSELFGAAVEAIGVTRLPFGIGSWIGRLTNSPGSSAKTLASQSSNIQSDARQAVMRATNSQEALINLDTLDEELNVLESQIAGNVARSSELRANPEDVDKIQRDILSVRNNIYYYRKELLLNPATLQELQKTLSLSESIDGGSND